MDDQQALAIVSALANGANPATGEIFAADSPYQSPNVIRALFAAQKALEARLSTATARSLDASDSMREPVNAMQPAQRQDKMSAVSKANAGKPWSAEEDKQLLAAFDAKHPLTEIADTHGRTVNGVRTRLEKHGRLEPSSVRRWPDRVKGQPTRQVL